MWISQSADRRSWGEGGTTNFLPSAAQDRDQNIDREYAETLGNSAPEPIMGTGTYELGRYSSTAALGQHAGSSEGHPGDTNVENAGEPSAATPRRPWYKRATEFKSLVIVTVLLGTTGVILGILGGAGVITGVSRGSVTTTATPSAPTGYKTLTIVSDMTVVPSTTSSPMTTATTTTTSAKKSSTTTLPPPTATPHDLCNPIKFFHKVKWAGISSGSSAFASSPSANQCCQGCARTPKCAGWVYDGTNEFTPCTMIMSERSGDDDNFDTACPVGYANIIDFKLGGTMDGGIGPCARNSNVD